MLDRYIIDTSGISKMFDLAKSGRTRKVARLWYVNKMAIKDIAYALGYGDSVVVSEIIIINKLIENNISSRTCSQCGQTFYSGQKGKQLCPVCMEKNKKEQQEQVKLVYKVNIKTPKSKKIKKFKSLLQIEKERAIYNKEHNTLLSYGQYVALTGD